MPAALSAIDTRESARPIVQAILRLGKAIRLSVTAEGVETKEHLALLAADQCNEVQGFLMAKPLRAQQIDELLTEMPTLKGARREGVAA